MKNDIFIFPRREDSAEPPSRCVALAKWKNKLYENEFNRISAVQMQQPTAPLPTLFVPTGTPMIFACSPLCICYGRRIEFIADTELQWNSLEVPDKN